MWTDRDRGDDGRTDDIKDWSRRTVEEWETEISGERWYIKWLSTFRRQEKKNGQWKWGPCLTVGINMSVVQLNERRHSPFAKPRCYWVQNFALETGCNSFWSIRRTVRPIPSYKFQKFIKWNLKIALKYRLDSCWKIELCIDSSFCLL